MNQDFYTQLSHQSISGQELDDATCRAILLGDGVDLLPLINAAYTVRKHFRGLEVVIHIINNAQNGHCPEDCHYCAQAKSSEAQIEEYGLKSEEEMLAEAREAYSKGAYRYCMVYAGRGASEQRIERLSRLIRKIKAEFPKNEICVSTGFVTPPGARELKSAGLDRLNHNLNSSESFYPNICTTHTFSDRLNTLMAAKEAGIEVCSGMIAGMGEAHSDVIEIAKRLRSIKAASIPVNFLIPIEGNKLSVPQGLTPQYCLRILCLFRFLNPDAEIRVGAGREGHLRSMEIMSLYPASSLFLQGYLNTKGSSNARTLRMIKDAGFEIKSDENLDHLIAAETEDISIQGFDDAKAIIKDLKDLRPVLKA
ncbi:MAG: biotin synthase BioB [Candidatus Omnitrophica bacterium]|nr:biotin synthase BioB [Candidatus Omnitrophota bacterium]